MVSRPHGPPESASRSDAPTRLWTCDEYRRLAELGILDPEERVELLEGEIVMLAAQRPPHSTSVRLVEEALRKAFGAGWDVRSLLPLTLGKRSEPEADVAVVRGSIRDYAQAHPTTAALVVEVSDTTLRLDRSRKWSIYAKGAIPEYWIVNLVDRVVEVHRDPGPLKGAQYGAGYTTRHIAGEDGTVSPLAAPESAIAVKDLLP
ncbi:MAG: Uma2 family endonuclease [Myxococcota bacterium]